MPRVLAATSALVLLTGCLFSEPVVEPGTQDLRAPNVYYRIDSARETTCGMAWDGYVLNNGTATAYGARVGALGCGVHVETTPVTLDPGEAEPFHLAASPFECEGGPCRDYYVYAKYDTTTGPPSAGPQSTSR